MIDTKRRHLWPSRHERNLQPNHNAIGADRRAGKSNKSNNTDCLYANRAYIQHVTRLTNVWPHTARIGSARAEHERPRLGPSTLQTQWRSSNTFLQWHSSQATRAGFNNKPKKKKKKVWGMGRLSWMSWTGVEWWCLLGEGKRPCWVGGGGRREAGVGAGLEEEFGRSPTKTVAKTSWCVREALVEVCIQPSQNLFFQWFLLLLFFGVAGFGFVVGVGFLLCVCVCFRGRGEAYIQRSAVRF